jgi:transposase
MIPVAAGVRIWIASGHTDMRKGMNGLALLVQGGPWPRSHRASRSEAPLTALDLTGQCTSTSSAPTH